MAQKPERQFRVDHARSNRLESRALNVRSFDKPVVRVVRCANASEVP